MAVKKGQEVAKTGKVSLLAKMAAESNLEPANFLATIKNTVMKGNPTNEQVTAFLMVADRYQLDPILKQIHAFADKGGGVIPIVGNDGWNMLAQRHPQFNGEVMVWSEEWVKPEGGKPCPKWGEISVYRKDHQYPTVHREYIDEVYRKTGPWMSNTKRMLEHKVRNQGYRIAFGFSGIYDEDEAQRIEVEGMPQQPVDMPSSNAEKARMALGKATTPEDPPKAAERPVEDEVEFSAARIKGGVIEDITDEFEDVTEDVEVDEVTGEVLEEESDDFQRVTDLAKQALGAVEEAEEVEPAEERVIPPVTKKQLDALVAAKKRGGWSNELVSRLIKEQYGVAKAAELNREQALELMKHLLAGSEEAQEGLDV